MPRLSPLCIAWACAALATSHTFAAPAIWRCGNSYSDLPCEGGSQIGAAGATPSAEQRRQADEGTRKDQAAAQRMERERLHLEARAPRSAAVIAAPPREAKHAAAPYTVVKPNRKKAVEKADAFVASSGRPPPKERSKKPRASED